MTNSQRQQGRTRAPSSKGKGKGRQVEPEAGLSSKSRKHSRSIADYLSSSQREKEPEDAPQTPTKRLKRGHRSSTSQSRANCGNLSFMDMYSFPSKQQKTNGTIDLTGASAKALEHGHIRKTSFAQTRHPAFNPHQGPKKLVVKNLRTTPRVDPEQYFERIWNQQDTALTAIFGDQKLPFSLEELYKGGENMCRQGKAAELYRRLKLRCRNHITGHVKEAIRAEADCSSDMQLLRIFVDAWTLWQKQLMTIRQIFYYMDQAYLLRSAEHSSVMETGLILFRTEIFTDSVLKEKILSGITGLFNSDRDAELQESEKALLKKSIDSLHELGVYTSDFEPAFGKSSETYFRAWRASNADSADLAQYINDCTDLLEQEFKKCDEYNLDRTTRRQISTLFEALFVEQRVDRLTDEESLFDLFEQDKFSELERAYTLLQYKGLGEKLGPAFDKYVVEEGTAIVFDEKREEDMVINLLEFKRRLDRFLKFSFENNEQLGNGLHKSFELFINKTKKTQANWDTDNAKPGEMIAKHVDLLLKGGVKAVPKLVAKPTDPEEEQDFDEGPADEDAEINHHLSNALDLFRFVHGKAVFEAFYKKDLARRLLMGRSASNDAERNMLSRLKNECGAGFTHNLESMFKDMDLAREEMASYNQLLEDRGVRFGAGHVDLSVNVLSSAAWPTYSNVPVNVPPAISQAMTNFDEHYQTKHSGRKLTWKNALAHCQLKAKFPRGNKEIVVSGFQAIVLLLFNDLPSTPDASYSYKELQAATGLPDAELKRTLQSLACAKYRVLTKHPRGRDVAASDRFSYNAGFADAKMRIKINQIQLRETKEENRDTHKRVAQDRHYETQAAIVRIMKSRKSIRHVELVSEVIKMTKSRGVLDPADIKKNIEKLIEKDYMERMEDNTYSYVA